MATEDYYMVLEVVQTATPGQVVESYRRLARKLHPDKNPSSDATQAFQLTSLKLGKAYETLKDEGKRRAYDLIYPSITRGRPSPRAEKAPPPQNSESYSEAAQIAALQKSKQERRARWQTTKNSFDSSIFKLQEDIRRLEQGIKNLDSIVAAEAAKRAQENSWGTWLLSSIYKKVEESEEEKERKDRERQERRIEKDMKERRFELKKADLKTKEGLLKRAKEDVDAADLADDRKIAEIQRKIWLRESREREERERIEREKMARERQERQRMEAERMEREREAERERIAQILKEEQQQREKREREAAEALRKQLEEQEMWQKYRDDKLKQFRERYNPPGQSSKADQRSPFQDSASSCRHGGWWAKLQGRSACPECDEVWTYLLQCPGCKRKACPKCQSEIRPRMPHSNARKNQRPPPREKAPSPLFEDFYLYGD
ncbi:hypothetical protein DSL72_003867 [Monilinia vaccinii-corymbosi]|uniref:J domain-containing protein n=1 Tax=Monilinia vaccinii-corymbosi TaxID=61207 RepID=A0A8A3NV50_9HELO|nr:hypothetical protein DSL72_003867 [Monilinia vaccinii-corymbosi]